MKGGGAGCIVICALLTIALVVACGLSQCAG